MDKKTFVMELGRLNKYIRRFIEKHSKDKYDEKITGPNIFIIRYIAKSNKDVYQKDLERDFGITRSTASKIIKLMKEKGLIRTESVEQDGRLKKLILEDKAKIIYKKVRLANEALEKKLLSGFTEEEIKTLRDYIIRMEDNLKEEN